jgi:hypothetical protein
LRAKLLAAVTVVAMWRSVDLADLNAPLSTEGHGLALPMALRRVLVAVVIVGMKPRHAQYRPDELALLAASVQSVGHDMNGLRVEALERNNARLTGDAAPAPGRQRAPSGAESRWHTRLMALAAAPAGLYTYCRVNAHMQRRHRASASR